MAATLTTAPPAVALNGDGIYVQVDTDLINSDASYLELTVTGSPSAGQELEFSWPGGTVLFTVTDPATGDPTEWPLPAAGQTDAEYADDLRDFLDDGGLFAGVFNISRDSGGGEKILITHVLNGAFDITVDNNTMSGIADAVTNATGDAPPDNLHMIAIVHSNGVGAIDIDNQKLFASHANYLATAGAPLIDIHPAFAHLSAFLPAESSIVLPNAAPPSNWYAVEATSMFQQYYIRYGERYGLPATVRATFREEGPFVALLGAHGGVSEYVIGRLCHDYYRRDGDEFRKPVSRDQPDWAYVYTSDFLISPIAASLTVQLTWSDGSTSNYTPYSSGMPTLEQQKLYCFATGYRQLKLHLAPLPGGAAADAYIVEYNVLIGPQDDSFSYLAYIAYSVPPDYQDWNTYLLFVNGVGGLESAWMRGRLIEQYGVEATEYQRARWGSSRPSDFRDFDNSDASGRPKWEVSTGWYADPYYLVHLRQMPLAQAWLIDMDDRRFLPVTVQSTDSAVTQQDEVLHELTFKIEAGWYDDAANL